MRISVINLQALTSLSLFLHFPTSLIINCLSLLFGAQLLYSSSLFDSSSFFSNSLLKSNFSLCSSSLLPNCLTIMIITLNSIRYIALSPHHLVLLGFYFFLLGMCSSVISFFLIRCSYFYVSGGLVTFPDLGEVASCRFQQHILLWIP